MISVLSRRRAQPELAPSQPTAAAVAVFPVLGSGVYLVSHRTSGRDLLGPAVWDVFALSDCPRAHAVVALSRLGLDQPDLALCGAKPTLVKLEEGDKATLTAVTVFLTPARVLRESIELLGYRRLGKHDLLQLLQAPGALTAESVWLLPALVAYLSA